MTEQTLAGIAIRRLEEARVHVDAGAAGRLDTYVEELSRWGRRLHLVGRGRLEENIVDLAVDSWLLCEFAASRGLLGDGKRIADVGAGAGFPGVVWAIARPKLGIVLFERKEKLLRFLERVRLRLGVTSLETSGDDPVRRPPPAAFDVVVTRAAGRLSVALPLAASLLRPGGAYLTIKGDGWRDELAGVDPAAGMRFEAEVSLPGGRGHMVLFLQDRPRG